MAFEPQVALADSVGRAHDALRDAVAVSFATALHRPDEAVAFAAIAEQIGRLADALRIAAAAGVVRSNACAEYQVKDAAAVLSVLCRVERAEARRRVAIAEVVADRPALTGEVLAPAQPELASAVRHGEVTGASAYEVVKTSAKICEVVTDESLEKLTLALIDEARSEDDSFVRSCAKRIVDNAHPDGTEPTEAVLRMKQGITFGPERNGFIPFAGNMTAMQYETVISTIGTFTNPRLQAPDPRSAEKEAGEPTAEFSREHEVTIQPSDGGTAIRVELRGKTRAQLLLEGMVATCELAARTGALPRNGGTRASVILTVSLDDLREGLGDAAATFAGPIPARHIRQLACDAMIIPAVLGSEGAVLDMGRDVRLVDKPLRTALIARDGGCAFPSCDAPSPWTDGHHIRHWADGGSTSLENTVLLCRAHHTLIHNSDWRIVLIDGIPHFTPPRQIDPHQRPRRNRRHRLPTIVRRTRIRRPTRG